MSMSVVSLGTYNFGNDQRFLVSGVMEIYARTFFLMSSLLSLYSFISNRCWNSTTYIFDDSMKTNAMSLISSSGYTSHSAYVATETESNGANIDGLLPPNFL